MADLLGNDIGLNYKGLLNLFTTINTGLDATLRVVTDGEGDSSPLYLSTTAIGLGTTSIWDNTNGRLGIGTTSPIYKLDINETVVRGGLRVKGLGGGGIIIGAITSTLGGLWSANITPSDTNYSFIGDGANSYFNGTTALNFMVADSQKAILNSTGLGIGVTPTAQLDVVAASSTVGLYVKGAASTDIARFYQSDGALSVAIQTAGGRPFTFNSSGLKMDSDDSYCLSNSNGGASAHLKLRTYDNSFGFRDALFVKSTTAIVGINNNTPTAQLDIVAASATVGLYVKGAASTDIARFYQSDGTTYSKIDSASAATFGALKPLADQTYDIGTSGLRYNTCHVQTVSGVAALTLTSGNWSNIGTINGFLFQLSGSHSPTSGTLSFMHSTLTFNPTSGTAIMNQLVLDPTINQTGGANGISRAIYVNPTLTAAADFRAIDVTKGSVAFTYIAVSGTYPILNSDYTIECTANTFTTTLPTAVGCTGRIYVITNSGAGTVTIATTSSQTFVNVVATPTTLTLATLTTYRVQSNGANWLVI